MKKLLKNEDKNKEELSKYANCWVINISSVKNKK